MSGAADELAEALAGRLADYALDLCGEDPEETDVPAVVDDARSAGPEVTIRLAGGLVARFTITVSQEA